MDDDPIRQITNDQRLELYDTFFDHGWAREVMVSAQGTPIANAVFDLTISWKAAANTHRMPFMLMSFLQAFWDGIKRKDVGKALVPKAVREIQRRLCSEVKLTQTKKKQVQTILDKIAADVLRAEEEADVAYPGAAMWEDANNPSKPGSSELQLGIWASQRLCFGALYHAYENFIRELIGMKKGEPDYRLPRFPRFLEDATECLGPGLVAECITDPAVNTARLIRHALAHKGGRVTDELREIGHNLPVNGGVLQVLAPHNWALFDLLKVKVTRLVGAAVATV